MISMISSFFEKISLLIKNNPISTILLTICTILGALWGKKGLAKKRLSFRSVSFPIIRESTNAISNVNILYKNQSIPDLTITNFIIWSSSDKSIRKNDIVPLSPLHFATKNPEAKILDISIVETNNTSSNIQITPDNDEFIFSFDYLKKKSGAVVQIIHTGQDVDIEFTGELIDGNLKCENFSNLPILKHLTKTPSPKVKKIMTVIDLALMSIALFLLAILSCIMVAFTSFSVITIMFLFILLIIFYFYFLLYKTYFNVPRTLSSYLTLDK